MQEIESKLAHEAPLLQTLSMQGNELVESLSTLVPGNKPVGIDGQVQTLRSNWQQTSQVSTLDSFLFDVVSYFHYFLNYIVLCRCCIVKL